MAIIGLTDQAARLPNIGQLRKGEKKTTSDKPGKDLTYFRFTSEGDEEVDKLFCEAYPNQESLRKINVYLPYPTTIENFDPWNEKWVAGGLVHRCDGKTCVSWRKLDGSLSFEPKSCQGDCGAKPVGRLSVMIMELGRYATVTILTTSKNDIANLTRQLKSYEMLRGDLRKIPFVVTRCPKIISTPRKGGKRARSEKWLLSIEAQKEWAAMQLDLQTQSALPMLNDKDAEDPENEDFYIDTPEEREEIIDPFDTGEVLLDTPPQPPAPNPKQKNGNGNGQRPYDPTKLYDRLHKRSDELVASLNRPEGPAKSDDINLMRSKIAECFGPDSSDEKVAGVTSFLWSKESPTECETKATLWWLLVSQQPDDTNDHPLHENAPEEARKIYQEFQLASGQLDLFEEEK